MCATILPLLVYLLVEVFQEAIEDFQEVLDRLFISCDNIFSCRQKLSELEPSDVPISQAFTTFQPVILKLTSSETGDQAKINI